MTSKTKNIIGWVLAGMVAFIFLGSAFGKLTADATALEGVAKMGLDANTYKILGIIEIIAVALFLYPRTGIIGTLLLVAYMGGAIATQLEHSQSVMAPVIVSAFVWIVAVVRFPELTNRLLHSNN